MKQHLYHTYNILNSIDGFGIISEWSAHHHEKINGNGYPFRKDAGELNIGSRIIAVSDVFTALIEDRPYRKSMDLKQVESILREMAVDNSLDSRIVDLLIENLQDIRMTVVEKQQQTKEFYHTEIESL